MPHTMKVGIWAFSKSANRLEVGGSLSFLFAESCHSMLVMGGVAIIIMLPMGSGSRLHRVTTIPTANERTGIIMPNRADSWIIVRPHAKVMTMNQNMGAMLAQSRAIQNTGPSLLKGIRKSATLRLTASERAGTSQLLSLKRDSTRFRLVNKKTMTAMATAQ